MVVSFSETLEKNKAWVIPLVLLAIGGAIGFSVWRGASQGISNDPINQAYFTVDEGKTYFTDDINKNYPFTHEGKEAYRAYVYRCGENGKPFVGVIGRQIEATGLPVNPNVKSQGKQYAIEIRKPNTDKWTPLNGPEGMKLVQGVCPDGRPQSILPGEE